MNDVSTSDDKETRLDSLVKNVNLNLPGLPTLGFAFWFAWNLIAFSGTLWTSNESTGYSISLFFIFHLFSSTLTHIIVARSGPRTLCAVMSKAWPVAGALVGSLGTVLMLYMNIDSASPFVHVMFAAGCIMAGVGTSLLFIRSAPTFCMKKPRASFVRVFLSALFAIAVYFIIDGYSSTIGPALFALLPCFSALCVSVKRYTPLEATVYNTVLPAPRQFWFLLLAIFVYSFAQETTKSFLLAGLDAAQSAACMQYVMLGLLAMAIVMVGIELSMPQVDLRFGRIYYPLALVLILPQFALPVFSAMPLLPAVLIDFAGYGFDLLLWAMSAFLAYRMQGNVIRFICMATAALSVGLALGSALGIFLLSIDLDSFSFFIVNSALATASILMTIFVFPEKRLDEIFISDDEAEDDTASTEAQERAAYWDAALDLVASKGGLTAREKQVLAKVASGMTAQQIADELVLSVHTVRAHTRNIHSKLEVKSRKEITDLIESHIDL